MSVHVPTHFSMVPSALRSGSARPSIQRYVPSHRRSRYSISYGSPVEVACAQRAAARPRSSGWKGGFHPNPRLASSVNPVKSIHCWL